MQRRGMAGGTLGVVCGGILLHLSVRIVAGGAANASIVGIEAFAVGQAVGLEADIIDTARTVEGDLGPCAVTAAATLEPSVAVEPGQLSNRPCKEQAKYR
jgi:hypothetical protein